ncbi:MAG: hypothetical protein SGI90_11005 [Candidatus Eisenbacteria bacterium]|nr:hypothetical protein [Candidatus Eisenbacteria bacterium]
MRRTSRRHGFLGRLAHRLKLTLLSGAIWGSEERLTSTTTDSETGLNQRTMAIDGTGGLHAVWAEQNGPRGNYQVMTRRRPSGGAWSAAELVVPFRPEGIGNLLGAKFPAIVSGPGDSLHLAWHDYRHGGILNCEVYYKTTPAGAAWDTSAAAERRLTTTSHPETNGDNGYVPALAMERNGNCHLAWYDFRFDGQAAEILTKSRIAGGWNTTPGDAADLNISMTGGDSQFPDMVVDGRGGLHVVWQDDTAGNWRVYYTHRPAGSVDFEPPIPLTTHGLAATVPVVVVDGPGRVTVAWVDAREGIRRLYARNREIDGTWTAERPASPAGFTADEPTLAVDEFARTWLAWHDNRFGVTNREIVIQCAAAGMPFDSTGAGDVRVSNGSGSSGRPTLQAPGDGTIHVLYRDRRDGNHEIYHREGTLVVPVGVPDGSPLPVGRLTAAPNPVREGTTLRWVGFSQVAGRPVVADLFDVAGRRRTSLTLTPGESIHWQPVDETGRMLSAGSYWLRPRDGHPAPLQLVVVR